MTHCWSGPKLHELSGRKILRYEVFVSKVRFLTETTARFGRIRVLAAQCRNRLRISRLPLRTPIKYSTKQQTAWIDNDTHEY